jgi:hypothetical protein
MRSPAAIKAPFRRKTLMKSGVSGAATSFFFGMAFFPVLVIIFTA